MDTVMVPAPLVSTGAAPVQRGKRFLSFSLVVLGGVLLVLSTQLIQQHIQAIQEVRETALPTAAQLPFTERRVKILEEQVELSELHAATRIGSQEERLRAFVLPQGENLARILSLFDAFRSVFEGVGLLGMSEIEVGNREQELEVEGEALFRQPISVELHLKEEALPKVFAVLQLAGVLTVGDILRPEELALLLRNSEEESPTGIVALEPFLSTDLLSYLEEPKPFEERLLKSFPSESFRTAFQDVLQSSSMREAKELLGGPLGGRLTMEQLWPMQFLAIEEASIAERADGTWNLGLTLLAYSR